jgi:hypothetical protein
MNFRNFAKTALLVFVSLAASFLVAEAGLRIGGVSFPVFHGFEHGRGRVLVPGAEGWFRGEGSGYVVINSAGFRDVEHTLEKPPGTYRILLLGDSFTEARQVVFEDTFGRRLESKLDTCARLQSQDIEVINFGVPGYGNAEELMALRARGWDYSPDLVVLMFYSGNDVIDNYPEAVGGEASFIPRPHFRLEDGVLTPGNNYDENAGKLIKYRLSLWAVRNFRTLQLANQAVRAYRSRGRGEDEHAGSSELPDFVYAPPMNDTQRDAWALTDAIVGQIADEVTENDANFMLVTVTSPNQLGAEQRDALMGRLQTTRLDYPEKRMLKLGEAHGFPVLNLLYDFKRYGDEHDVFLHGFPNTSPGVGHWNENGHALASTLMAEQICQDPSVL